MNEGMDRTATVCALVRGESGVLFKTALFDARSNEEGLEVNEITTDHVRTALRAVTASVFPHTEHSKPRNSS
jgi:hypothetical protein